MKGSEFLRKVQGLARCRGMRFRYEPSLGTGLVRAMCRDLGIEVPDL